MTTNPAGEIAALTRMSLAELRAKYGDLFGGRPSRSGHRRFLIRRIAWRIQELAYGGLSEEAGRRLEELAAETDPLRRYALRKKEGPGPGGSRARRRVDRRLPRPGTVLTRRYAGRVVAVTVLEKGFEFDGRTYRSLSAVAREVTGAHWNGFLFFNL